MSNSKKQLDFYMEFFKGHDRERTLHEWYCFLHDALYNIKYNYYHSETNYIKFRQLREIIYELNTVFHEYHQEQNCDLTDDVLY